MRIVAQIYKKKYIYIYIYIYIQVSCVTRHVEAIMHLIFFYKFKFLNYGSLLAKKLFLHNAVGSIF